MTSYASWMPSSPGIIYHSPVGNGNNNDDYNHNHKQKKKQQQQEQEQEQQQQHQQQQLSSVHKENMRLKASLTRVQNEYEELRDESNYQRAKVSELSDQIVSAASTNKQQKQQSSSSNYYYNNKSSGSSSSSGGVECGESTVHNRLIDTSIQNAELNITIDKLKNQIQKSDIKMKELQIQKRTNNKLLLEMSDVVRALNSVHVEYGSEYSDSHSHSHSSHNNDDSNSSSATSKKKEVGDNHHLNAQQSSSIKKIKLKVEAIMDDRSLLVRRCKELDEETYNQQQQIKVLEAQFHIMNTTNIYKGVELTLTGALGGDANANANADADAETIHTAHTTVTSTSTIASTSNNIIGISNSAPNSPNSVYSFAAQSAVSNMTTPITMMQHDDDADDAEEQAAEEESSTMMSTTNSRSSSQQSQGGRSPAAEYVRQSKELARYKQHEEKQLMEINELKKLKDIQIDTINSLRLENECTTKRMQSLYQDLNDIQEEKQDSIIKRDEYKDNLHDIVVHYKKLNIQHLSTKKQLKSLQTYVKKLEIELQKTNDDEQEWEEIEVQEDEDEDEDEVVEEEKECNTHEEEEVLDDAGAEVVTSSSSTVNMEDLKVAYDNAMKKINILETNLLSAHGLSKDNRDRQNYRDTASRFKTVENERNDFQRKLNKALEETQQAKMEAKNEREEAKNVRKRLTFFLRNKDKDKDKDEDEDKDDDDNNTLLSSSSSSSKLSTSTSTKVSSLVSRFNSNSNSNPIEAATFLSPIKSMKKEPTTVPFKPLSIEELMKKDFA